MNCFCRKVIPFLLVMILSCTGICSAQETVDVILTTGPTQAFTKEAVNENDLNSILAAGVSTASAINQQPWFFVAISNQDIMAELAGGGGAPAGAAMMPSAGDDFAGSSGMPAAPAEGSSGMPSDMAGSSGMPSDMAGSSGMPAAPTGTSTGAAKAALGDSPVAIIIYMNTATASPDASFDCGLACQNMVIAASALGYGTKIVSSPTMTLNGAAHDVWCEKLGVDPALQAVAVLLIGKADVDAVSSASVRNALEEMVSIVK